MKFLNFLLNFAVNLNLLRKKVYLKGEKNLDFPGGPLLRLCPSNAGGTGLSPGQTHMPFGVVKRIFKL